MSHLEHIQAPTGMSAGNGYSHVVTGTGRLVFVAGQVALDEHGTLVGAGDIQAQTRQVFENLRRALAAAGATFADVVKLSFFLTDMTPLPTVRPVRDEYIDTARPPASTAVQVASLFAPEFLIEIEALALVAED